MEAVQEIEDFYGVYLLCSKSDIPKYRNRTYIGFTVNPNRRVNQHNKGRKFGGAKKTSDRGPREMVIIIHGFPNNISALRFDWAWQQPTESRRLKVFPEIQRRKPRESHFDYNFRVLVVMLRIGPWNRLPLTIRWLCDEYARVFPIGQSPPLHMPSAMEKVSDTIMTMTTFCKICYDDVKPDNSLSCILPNCRFTSHLKCLAKLLLEPGQYVPIQGSCPSCKKTILWGDLIRKRNGCSDLENCAGFESGDDDTVSDEIEIE